MKLDRRRMSGVRSLLTALPFVLSPASAAPVDFAHDIAPIIYRNSRLVIVLEKRDLSLCSVIKT